MRWWQWLLAWFVLSTIVGVLVGRWLGRNDRVVPHPIYEWCGFCGAVMWRTLEELEYRIAEPPCPRCGETDWRGEAEAVMLLGGQDG